MSAADTPLGGATIAVVDDDPRIQRLLEAEIQDLGHRIICHQNALSFLENLDRDKPALVLLDLLMPEMDGMECLRRLRQTGYAGPVIIFTALSDDEKRREADQEGATEYILKPDLFENLKSILARHL